MGESMWSTGLYVTATLFAAISAGRRVHLDVSHTTSSNPTDAAAAAAHAAHAAHAARAVHVALDVHESAPEFCVGFAQRRVERAEVVLRLLLRL